MKARDGITLIMHAALYLADKYPEAREPDARGPYRDVRDAIRLLCGLETVLSLSAPLVRG